jgi:hypothetical protein
LITPDRRFDDAVQDDTVKDHTVKDDASRI